MTSERLAAAHGATPKLRVGNMKQVADSGGGGGGWTGWKATCCRELASSYVVEERLASGLLCHQTSLDKAVGERQVVKHVDSCGRCRTLLGSRVTDPFTCL